MENKDIILKALKDNKELKASEISQITGLDKKIVDKEIANLKKEEAIISPKRCYWSAK
jgi:predicted HTH transcriptional regulator